MENRYDGELVELKVIYQNTLEEIQNRFEAKLETVVKVMGDFLEMYTAQKKYEKKLEILNCKLKAERSPCCANECDDCCGDEDDCDE